MTRHPKGIQSTEVSPFSRIAFYCLFFVDQSPQQHDALYVTASVEDGREWSPVEQQALAEISAISWPIDRVVLYWPEEEGTHSDNMRELIQRPDYYAAKLFACMRGLFLAGLVAVF